MFSQRPHHFSQLARSYPILKLVDVYDRQSFIRTYVLDNIYVFVFIYILFYAALWYACNIIKRIERSNREMSATVEESKSKLDRLVSLRSKRARFEEVIVKTTGVQKVTSRRLEDEMHRLGAELIATSDRIAELERVVEKCKHPERKSERARSNDGVLAAGEGERLEEFEEPASPLESFKILEPSFPPSLPPEPPPRKYGIFVSRPPGQRRASPAAAPAAVPPKIGLK